MRWIWVDRIVEIEKGEKCVATKSVSSAEDVLHDHFEPTERYARTPVMPHSLVIEAMAQTAGVLVGYTGDFKEKVVLAKIGKAVFHCSIRPGFTMKLTATLERFDVNGAATRGKVEWIDPVTGATQPMADITLMFAHVDHNRSNIQFPEHNFVFSGNLLEMMQCSGMAHVPMPDSVKSR